MRGANIVLLLVLGIFALWLATTNKLANIPTAWKMLLTGNASGVGTTSAATSTTSTSTSSNPITMLNNAGNYVTQLGQKYGLW